MKAFETGDNIHTSCFASRPVSGLSLSEDVINEAEAAWSKVVAIVNNLHPSESLESQFYPLFAERATDPLMLEGKNFLKSFRSIIAFCLIFLVVEIVRIVTIFF